MIVSSPGRICLFGEHLDYLGLPVIAAAISLRIRIDAKPAGGTEAVLTLPDIGGSDRIPLDGNLSYRHPRDYLRSAVNVMRSEGFSFGTGFEAEVRGEIPINSGTASSSALVTAWVETLARMSDRRETLDPARRATLAHRSEVLEFAEPGGNMDHVAASGGGLFWFDPANGVVDTLPSVLGPFVLADSGQPKETKAILGRVKDGVLGIVRKLEASGDGFSLTDIGADELQPCSSVLSEDEMSLLAATIGNRDITRKARSLFEASRFDHRAFGKLLHRHQSLLRDPIGVSTPKIDAMIQAAYDAGALGAKINGSGGGGCLFAYAPEDPQAVLDALKPFGRAWIVETDEGTRSEQD